MDQDGPNTVKEFLAEIKDSSELMVDLAYAAVFFSDRDLAREVERLEERMFGHLHQLRKARSSELEAPRTPNIWRECSRSRLPWRRSATPRRT